MQSFEKAIIQFINGYIEQNAKKISTASFSIPELDILDYIDNKNKLAEDLKRKLNDPKKTNVIVRSFNGGLYTVDNELAEKIIEMITSMPRNLDEYYRECLAKVKTIIKGAEEKVYEYFATNITVARIAVSIFDTETIVKRLYAHITKTRSVFTRFGFKFFGIEGTIRNTITILKTKDIKELNTEEFLMIAAVSSAINAVLFSEKQATKEGFMYMRLDDIIIVGDAISETDTPTLPPPSETLKQKGELIAGTAVIIAATIAIVLIVKLLMAGVAYILHDYKIPLTIIALAIVVAYATRNVALKYLIMKYLSEQKEEAQPATPPRSLSADDRNTNRSERDQNKQFGRRDRDKQFGRRRPDTGNKDDSAFIMKAIANVPAVNVSDSLADELLSVYNKIHTGTR